MLTLVAGSGLGCATGARHARPTRVAVLGLDAVGVPKPQVDRIERSIADRVRRDVGSDVVAGKPVVRAMDDAQECRGSEARRSEACAVETGAKTGASHVVSGAIGGLGKTYVVQLRVFDVEKAAVVRSFEETLFGGLDAVAQQAGPMAVRLFDTAPAKPWYTRWWVWTALAVAATAAVVIPLSLSTGDSYEDVTLP